MKRVFWCFLLLLFGFGCGANEQSSRSIVGVWECEPFLIENALFVVRGNGLLHFSENEEMLTAYNYSYKFFDDSELFVDFEAVGDWRFTDGMLEESIKNLKIKKIKNNSPFSDSEVEELIRGGIIFNKPSKTKINFISTNELYFEKESRTVRCARHSHIQPGGKLGSGSN